MRAIVREARGEIEDESVDIYGEDEMSPRSSVPEFAMLSVNFDSGSTSCVYFTLLGIVNGKEKEKCAKKSRFHIDES